ncbi:MAG: SUMF1/EgtB/PvdO family nonheme iron enzyme [Anaerolineae bacterium]
MLSALGDPRDFDVLLPVPAGEFTMGSNDRYDSEKPAHPVWVGDFRIGAYPVSNAQYEEFVLATQREPPLHWRGPRAPIELRNHPVVYVGWDDANAYCAWRSRQEGRELRLPTEAEWEKAARGTDGRTWPWGNTFDAMKCNMGETGIGDTSPVGIFAAGRSPYEVFDMAGNVWQWTRSAWGEDWQKPEFGYPYRADDGREDQSRTNVHRVVRGGSFILNDAYVRCASRVGLPPGARHNVVGFRVVAPGL